MMIKEKKERKVTPVCECRWAHIHEPAEPFDAGERKKFEIELVFGEDNPEMYAWAGELNAKAKALGLKGVPIKKDMEKNEDGTKTATGKFFTRFSTGEAYPPKVLDARGQTIGPETKVGNGSLVQLSYIENQYPGFGGGINLYLNAVCVRELVPYEGNDSHGFDFDAAGGSDDFDIDGPAGVGNDGKNEKMRDALADIEEPEPTQGEIEETVLEDDLPF